MAGRKVASRTEAEALLADWRAEGGDFKRFCRVRGLDGRSMQCWRMNLDRRSEPRPVRLLELTVPRPARPPVYRVVVGRFTVEVGDDFHEDTLGRLLDLVAAC